MTTPGGDLFHRVEFTPVANIQLNQRSVSQAQISVGSNVVPIRLKDAANRRSGTRTDLQHSANSREVSEVHDSRGYYQAVHRADRVEKGEGDE